MSVAQRFKDIADAIREVKGTTVLYTPLEMPAAIRSLIRHTYRITVTGGYNGGATISVYKDNSVVFTATGDSPYNLVYTPAGGTVGELVITITPPATSFGVLIIELSGEKTYSTGNISPAGGNTSYGYNYDSGIIT